MMKTKQVYLIALTIICVNANSLFAADTAWINLLSDEYYGFELAEAKETGWWMQHPDNFSLTNEKAAPGGNYSLKYSNSEAATGQLKAHGSSAIDDMVINLPAGTYTVRAMVWIDPDADITGFRTTIKKTGATYISSELSFDGKTKGEWVEVSNTITLEEAVSGYNMLVIVAPNHGGKGTLYIDNIRFTNGETEKPVIPYFTTIKTINNGNLNLQQGIYTVELNVYKTTDTNISSIFTMVSEPYSALEWNIDTLIEEGWVKLSQELVLPKNVEDSDFTIHINNHPLYGGGTGSIYIDDIKFIFQKEYTALAKLQTSFDYKIYPNPSSNNIRVEAPQKSNYLLYNLNGNIVASSNSQSNLFNINVAHLPKGFYFLQIDTDNKRVVEKIQIR